ncbi:MAG: hypothetical protein ACI9ND_002516 [Yoonia sp.]|jgi:hypothetical protein
MVVPFLFLTLSCVDETQVNVRSAIGLIRNLQVCELTFGSEMPNVIVYTQSLPFSRLADRIMRAAGSGGRKGEGSVLGGLSGMFGYR